MKVLGFIVGVIVVLVVGVSVYALVRAPQKEKEKQIVSTNLTKDTFGVMLTSEEKIQEAQKILSQKETTDKEQNRAKQLINEAITDAQKATRAQPNNPRTWYYLSETYQKLQDVNPKSIDLSIDALNKALALTPQNATLLNERATMYILKKNYTAAEKNLQQAIKLEPKRANHYYKLGNIYRVTGKKEAARKLYLQAKDLTPTNNNVAIAQIDHQIKLLDKGESAEKK